MEGPNFDYKYGIFARINRGNGSWNRRQIKLYMDKKGYPYNEDDTKEQLVEELKKWEK